MDLFPEVTDSLPPSSSYGESIETYRKICTSEGDDCTSSSTTGMSVTCPSFDSPTAGAKSEFFSGISENFTVFDGLPAENSTTSTDMLGKGSTVSSSNSEANPTDFAHMSRKSPTALTCSLEHKSTDCTKNFGENSMLYKGLLEKNSSDSTNILDNSATITTSMFGENAGFTDMLEKASTLYNSELGENLKNNSVASSSSELEKAKDEKKKKLKNSKEKKFSLDNMLPTLEASLNENYEKMERGDASNAEIAPHNNFTPVSIEANEDSEMNESPEASVNDSNFEESNEDVVREDMTVEPTFQEHINNSFEPLKKKKGGKRGPTNALVSYKNKEMSSEELEACNVGSDDKPYVCPICGSCFKQAFPLKRHMMIHSAVKPFFCTICDFRCNDGSNLRKHMQTHDDKKYTCPDCDYVCSRPDHLRNHRAKHTGLYKYVCGMCGYACNQACDLTRHMIVHGGAGGKFFNCEHCDYSTNRRSYLKLHMQKHLNAKELTCSICSFQAATPILLKKHLIIHTKEKTFQCDDCGQLTTSKSSLIRHRLVHQKTDEDGNPAPKRYQCRYCPFSCHWRSDLVKHLRRKHYFTDVNAIYVEVEAADTQHAPIVKREVQGEAHHHENTEPSNDVCHILDSSQK